MELEGGCQATRILYCKQKFNLVTGRGESTFRIEAEQGNRLMTGKGNETGAHN